MTGPGLDERWARVKVVFTEALTLPESERATFVASACAGDRSLEREIASLLASEQAAGSFCETPAAGLLAEDYDDEDPREHTPRLEPGTRLGSYDIVAFLSA